MLSKEDQVYGLTHQVRTLYNRMARVIDTLHLESDVNSGQRAILELLGDGSKTVPDMARERSISRQHVQLLVNELLDRGLVEAQPNPAHKRSSLISSTAKGRTVFDRLRETEKDLLHRISSGLVSADLKVTRQVIAELDAAFVKFQGSQSSGRGKAA